MSQQKASVAFETLLSGVFLAMAVGLLAKWLRHWCARNTVTPQETALRELQELTRA